MPDRRLSSPLLALAATLMTVPLVAGYWGGVHAAFDSFSHFRVHLAGLVIVLALPLLFRRGWRGIGLSAMVLAAAAILSVTSLPDSTVQAQGEPAAARYKLMQLNLRYDNATPKNVLSLIGRAQPDVVTLNEVSQAWLPHLESISDAYPHRIVCPPPSPIGGVAILSRRPFLHPATAGCFDRGSLAVVTVNFGGAAVDVAALHLGWPWPFSQPWQTQEVMRVLAGRLGHTAILAGDLNAVPWSRTVRDLATAGGLDILTQIGPTWLALPLPDALRRRAGLPIDNVLVKGRIVPLSTTRLEDAGSDHLPVLLDFSVEPAEGEPMVMQAQAGPAPQAHMF
ncbi:endonuclease/exonuclease/phosphatase family protein [Chelativorans intermedius]|uniref:Endonuclease/exonuclease/phosphatase family protein n=1 Tax=Chelativorans intermedius TaxID=515947 RepID=A0ABV6DA37_9HYPH|nr:endonuclease/exonuclease/phosphatase family protein [Chelativorans intermedius]MCT8999673.1 endonuclease/exonuclease/phosphatase family protein [Chelativorans intermedius]